MGTLHLEGLQRVQISNSYYESRFVLVIKRRSQEEVSCMWCKRGTPLKFWGISEEKIVFECTLCREEIILISASKDSDIVLEGVLEQELKNWSGDA